MSVAHCTIAILLFFGWHGPAPQQAPAQHIQEHTKANQAPPYTPPTPVRNDAAKKDASQSAQKAAANGEESVRITAAPKIKTESEKDSYDKALVSATWLLVLVGGFQILYLWRTVQATKDNALAAMRGAEAAIDAERPWLIVEIEPVELPSFDGIPPTNRLGLYKVIVRNKGRTPAEMIDGFCGKDIYPVPGFVPTDKIMVPFLAPVQTLTVPDDTFEVDRIRIDAHPIDRTVLPVQSLHVYGRIRYWDMFTDRTAKDATPYETQWCLTWEGSVKVWHRTANGYSRNT